jgi:hypothetical protein
MRPGHTVIKFKKRYVLGSGHVVANQISVVEGEGPLTIGIHKHTWFSPMRLRFPKEFKEVWTPKYRLVLEKI